RGPAEARIRHPARPAAHAPLSCHARRPPARPRFADRQLHGRLARPALARSLETGGGRTRLGRDWPRRTVSTRRDRPGARVVDAPSQIVVVMPSIPEPTW